MTSVVRRAVGDVIAEILMLRAALAGALLVVEGDDDIKFWQRRIAAQCQLVNAGGRQNVVGSVLGIAGYNVVGVLGVVDDDFQSLLGRVLPSKNLLPTGARDIESEMMASSALDSVLAEVADAASVAALESAEACTLREALLRRSLLFGRLRYVNCARGWAVAFHTLPPSRFVDVSTWTVDEKGLQAVFVTLVNGLAAEDLQDALDEVPDHDPWRVVRGKDALQILAIGVRKRVGRCQRSAEHLAQMLRLAYDDGLFRASGLYATIRTWEAQNTPFRVVA